MKSIFIFLVLQTLTIILFAHVNEPEKYFYNINKAELEIVDSNYANACEYYKKAFKYLDEPFGKDLHNFVICGFLTNDSVALQMCSPKFKARMYEYEAWFRDYKLFPIWKKLVEQSPHLVTIDTNFIILLDSLNTIDQINRRTMAYENDSINMIRLVNYLNVHHTFISEKNIGNRINGFNQSCAYAPLTCEMLLIHYSQEAFRRLDPVNLFLKEKVLSGEFSPDLYAHLCDFRGYGLDGLNRVSKGLHLYGTDTYCTQNEDRSITLHYPQYSKTELKEINKRRKEIYLPPYEDFLKKLKFEVSEINKDIQNKKFNLIFHWCLVRKV